MFKKTLLSQLFLPQTQFQLVRFIKLELLMKRVICIKLLHLISLYCFILLKLKLLFVKKQLGKIWGRPYSKISDYQCAPCNDSYKTYLRQILVFIALNVYIFSSYYLFCQIFRKKAIVYYLKMIRIISFGNSTRHDQSSTYLKFFITYAQLQSHINLINQNIILMPIKSIFGLPMSQIKSTIDCQISLFQNIHFVETITMISLPFVFCIWICAVYFIYSTSIRKQNILYKKQSSLILLSFISFQPNIVSYLIQSISCRQIGEYKYVVSDSRMKCFNDDHIYVIILSIFGLLIWVGIVPIYIYRKLINIKNKEWISVQYHYGFFYIEYKKSKIYWEIIRIYTKLLVVLIVNILHEYTVTQFVFLSFTLFTYYYLTDYLSPFETNHMNQVDKYIVTSLSIQVLLNAVIKDLDESNKVVFVFQIICFIINVGTLCSLVLIILLQKIKFFRNNIHKVKLHLSKFNYLKKIKFLKLNTIIETDFKRFNLWKKLSNNLHYAVVECQRIKYQQIQDSYFQQELSSQQLNKNKKHVQNIDSLKSYEQAIRRKFITSSSLKIKQSYQNDRIDQLQQESPKNQFTSFYQKQKIQTKLNSYNNIIQQTSQKNSPNLKSQNDISCNETQNYILRSPSINYKSTFFENQDEQSQKNFEKSNFFISENDRKGQTIKSIQIDQAASPLSKLLKKQQDTIIFSQSFEHSQLHKASGDILFKLDEPNSPQLTYKQQSTINSPQSKLLEKKDTGIFSQSFEHSQLQKANGDIFFKLDEPNSP